MGRQVFENYHHFTGQRVHLILFKDHNYLGFCLQKFMNKQSRYVLITAARNEEAFIEKTITSVISQTILPLKWIIVSDGSTDLTNEIVYQYEKTCNLIKLIRVTSDEKRNFSSKVNAFNVGYKQIKNLDYEFIGNLDADVSFESDYYERIIKYFQENPKLGIAGGIRLDYYDDKYVEIISNQWNVCGAIQMFRRQCFEDIEGFIPLRRGGEDAVAEIKARMCGWKIMSFPDIIILHHRTTGTADKSILTSRFNKGIVNYTIGYHPLYEIIRCVYHIRKNPCIIGSCFELIGFFWAVFRRQNREVPTHVVSYLRTFQINRLKSFFN